MAKDAKRVLVVDDEPDIAEAISEVLSAHQVDVAHSYDEAKAKLDTNAYDVLILDIMGVKGHELLDDYGERFPTIMLTAHALTPESFKKSVGNHARLFLPKEELSQLDEYVDKVLSTKQPLWSWLVRKLDFRRWFGSDFTDTDFFKGLTMGEIMDDLKSGRD
jgi:DNA-binding NtrC family response regulator